MRLTEASERSSPRGRRRDWKHSNLRSAAVQRRYRASRSDPLVVSVVARSIGNASPRPFLAVSLSTTTSSRTSCTLPLAVAARAQANRLATPWALPKDQASCSLVHECLAGVCR
jgi:hypothetical protein